MSHRSGRHFLQIPGPTNFPDRILRAIDNANIDHRGPAFVALTEGLLRDLKRVFRCTGPVVIYPGSGTAAWKAALSNTLSAGDRVLMYDTGHFATQWSRLAARLGLDVILEPRDWRHPVDSTQIAARLAEDGDHRIKAVAIVVEQFNLSLGTGLTKVAGRVFRIGHLGDFNELMLAGTLCGAEMGLDLTGVPHTRGGVRAALDYLSQSARSADAAGDRTAA